MAAMWDRKSKIPPPPHTHSSHPSFTVRLAKQVWKEKNQKKSGSRKAGDAPVYHTAMKNKGGGVKFSQKHSLRANNHAEAIYISHKSVIFSYDIAMGENGYVAKMYFYICLFCLQSVLIYKDNMQGCNYWTAKIMIKNERFFVCVL